MSTLSEMPDHLATLLSEAESAFSSFDAFRWNAPRGEGKWTSLQILGHLIDSAANNHQRFVRALAQGNLEWPGYDQIAHVTVQNYASADPALLLSLWGAYNRFLGHVMRQISPAKASTLCAIDGAPAISLADLALDYVAHLEHHLRQLLKGQSIHYSGMPWPPADSNRQWPV